MILLIIFNYFIDDCSLQNAEELTEEGLPFMILFRKKDDKVSPAAYRKVIERELRDEKGGKCGERWGTWGKVGKS